MTEISLRDQLFLNVGKCLTAWNHVENEILGLIEYAHSLDGVVGIETSVGYWSVISFDARLRWCDSIITYRLRPPPYSELSTRWRSLKDKVHKKAQKRAEIAHGSVITMMERGESDFTDYFVPYYNQRRTQFNLKYSDELHVSHFPTDAKHLKVSDIEARTASFSKARQDIRKFLEDWRAKDIETGYPSR